MEGRRLETYKLVVTEFEIAEKELARGNRETESRENTVKAQLLCLLAANLGSEGPIPRVLVDVSEVLQRMQNAQVTPQERGWGCDRWVEEKVTDDDSVGWDDVLCA